MPKKVKFILGLVVFIIATLLPLFAAWRYTGVGLTKNAFMISDTVFHVLLIVSLVLFYAQWKICPDTWLHVRAWFADHVWSFMFGMTILLIVHALLFVRFYTKDYIRFKSLKSDIFDCDFKLDSVEDEIKKIKGQLDDIDYKLQDSGGAKGSNGGWGTQRPATSNRSWY